MLASLGQSLVRVFAEGMSYNSDIFNGHVSWSVVVVVDIEEEEALELDLPLDLNVRQWF